MKRFLSVLILVLGFLSSIYAQVVTTDPEFPTADDEVTIFFDATEGTGGLENYNGDIYAHTGVITNKSSGGSDWRYVIADWDENTEKAKMEPVDGENNMYRLEIDPSIREFYGVLNDEIIEQMAFVFRNSDSSREGKAEGGEDIFAEVYEDDFNIKITQPDKDPAFYKRNSTVAIEGISSSENPDIELTLFIEEQQVAQVNDDTLEYEYTPQNEGNFEIRLEGTDGENSDEASHQLVVNPDIVEQDRPQNLQDGITYVDDSTVRLSLFAPHKEFVYLTGDFNNWEIDPDYFMNRETVNADSTYYWIEIDGLTPGEEYAFQYLVDGETRIADPYSQKILDPDNDQHISDETYPNLKPYPEGQEHIVGVLEPGKKPYNWQHTSYDRPENEELVVYELLIRDFIEEHSYKTLTDTLNYLKKLGVNAIELMPVMEFEGNISWGYNPSFLFATDKYYGPAEDLKKFIDEAHSRDIAVILDIVLNHVYGQSPLVRLWNEGNYDNPTNENPYLNIESPNQIYSWGYDFNHESQPTQYYVDRVTSYWLEEFNIDGYRFDFTKGFTQNPGDGWQHDSDRIRILKRMADRQWVVDDSSYVILEHLTAYSEEQELSDYGMMLWGNSNHSYNEATMGYHDNEDSDFSNVSHSSRGWSDAHLVGYMESHDEERVMYRNINFGNTYGGYDITELTTALKRTKMAAAFFFTIPGPKMIWQFGELGYDKSINLCEDGSISDDCRLTPKPVLWEYYEDKNRKKLHDTFQALIRLRNSHPAFTSEESDIDLDLKDPTKRITISHREMQATIIGNFGVKDDDNVQPGFEQSGRWFKFFTGDTLNITDTDTTISLNAGEFHIYTTEKFEAPDGDLLTGVIDGPDENEKASELVLRQNYPNPFNPTTTIPFVLTKAAEVSVKVFDVLGRKVMQEELGEQPSGEGEIRLDASGFSSGLYLYRVKAGSEIKSRKMMLIK